MTTCPRTSRLGGRSRPVTRPQGRWPGRGSLDGADRNKYQVMRRHFREQAAAQRDVCFFCDGPIDYSLKHGDPYAWELHHTVPVAVLVATGEGSPLDPRLWASSRGICNRVGVGVSRLVDHQIPAIPDTGVPSESW